MNFYPKKQHVGGVQYTECKLYTQWISSSLGDDEEELRSVVLTTLAAITNAMS